MFTNLHKKITLCAKAERYLMGLDIGCQKTAGDFSEFVCADESKTSKDFAINLHRYLVGNSEGLTAFLDETLNERER